MLENSQPKTANSGQQDIGPGGGRLTGARTVTDEDQALGFLARLGFSDVCLEAADGVDTT